MDGSNGASRGVGVDGGVEREEDAAGRVPELAHVRHVDVALDDDLDSKTGCRAVSHLREALSVCLLRGSPEVAPHYSREGVHLELKCIES